MAGRVFIGLVLLGMAALPHLVEIYQVDILILFLINLLLAQSYRQVTTTGDWSLSHVVLMGAGAYATALITKSLGWPFWLSLPLAGVAGAVVAMAVVAPLLRTVGFGFFIGSFALGEFVRLSWIKFQQPFGGARGLMGIPGASIGDLKFDDLFSYYYLTLAVVTVCLWVLYRVDRSDIGAVFKAVHMDHELCEAVGIHVPRFRALAFVIGGFFAGIAGALTAHHQGAIDPHSFEATLMVYLIIYVVVGGVETFWGPVLGVAVMMTVFELARPLEQWRPLLSGTILIVFLVFLPGGLELLLPRGMALLRRIPGLARLLPAQRADG